MRTEFAAFLTALPLMLVACSGDDTQLASEVAHSPSPTTEESSETPEAAEEEPGDPDLPTDEDIHLYVESIAENSVSKLKAATDLVVPDSPAADYLTYYISTLEADQDAGFDGMRDTDRITDIDDGLELCSRVPDGTDQCTTFTDFTGEDGQIYSFLIQGNAIEDRLVTGDGNTVEASDGTTVDVIATYLNASGTHTVVTYQLRSAHRGLTMPNVSYRSPEGRQSQAADHYGAWDLAPDSMSHYAAWFPQGELGGDLYLEIIDSEYYESETLTVPLGD